MKSAWELAQDYENPNLSVQRRAEFAKTVLKLTEILSNLWRLGVTKEQWNILWS
jgi:hypothetical protein